jgi:high-affinity Fe2+/Pb2+ permease
MSGDYKWPLTFERVRGHWIGLAFAFVAAGWHVFWQVGESGLASLFHVGPIVLIFLYGFLAYWFWRAIDYTGWRVMSRYLPRR